MSRDMYRRYFLLPSALCVCLILQMFRSPGAFNSDLGEIFFRCVVFPLLFNPVTLYNAVGIGEASFNAWICLSFLYWGLILFSYATFLRSNSQKGARFWAMLCVVAVLLPAVMPGPPPSSVDFRFPDIPV